MSDRARLDDCERECNRRYAAAEAACRARYESAITDGEEGSNRDILRACLMAAEATLDACIENCAKRFLR